MSVYIPLATKYRPQRFADVIGQDITIKIIMNGMIKNRLGAAMLFSGTRGIGKTTIARIVAKAFRCEHSTPEPCGKCESCLSFANGSQIDVIEIDAASNTSVDDVREIIESCKYKPTSGKFKIFIIDEVHMLSNSAFNALLKTLEEPPEHVKFLMATTETYKIPETILSRVLKFDLKRIDANVLAQHLSSICNQENITAGADVLMEIAKAADGSIRDSLSILDQVINVTDKNEITIGDVRNILGLSDESDIINLLKFILSADIKSSVKKFREILSGDISCEKIANTVLDYIYALTCIKSDIEIANNTVHDDIIEQLRDISKKVSLPALTRIWQMLLRGIEEIKMCDRPEIVLEMMLIRIAYASALPDLQDLIEEDCKNSETTNQKSLIDKNDKKQNEILSSEAVISTTKEEPVIMKEKTSESLLDEALKMFPNAILQS
ncbi:MAG: DNA polymerase III subunit gamma/tau [Alphaproteobacteria bacterium]|nr:DNA polymerase III subunit gamma/tau [Alphaproteobacteria bacterium]